MRYALFFLSVFCVLSLHATELKPWFGRPFEITPQLLYTYQTFAHYASDKGTISSVNNDHFLLASMHGNYWGQLEGEVEFCFAVTDKQHFNLDHWKITGRYPLLNDSVGDVLSLTVGLSAAQVLCRALHDPSSFHHGKAEFELLLSLGKEFICEADWTSRIWALFACGQANRDLPWLRFLAHWEKKVYNSHQLGLSAEFLFGFGGKALNLVEEERSFSGYGKIAHRSLDLGCAYRYCFCYGAELALAYTYRAYERNFPKNASRVMVVFSYPFGL